MEWFKRDTVVPVLNAAGVVAGIDVVTIEYGTSFRQNVTVSLDLVPTNVCCPVVSDPVANVADLVVTSLNEMHA